VAIRTASSPAPALERATVRVAALAVVVGLVLADSSIAVLALPAIAGDYGVEVGDLHWVLTAFNLALAAAAIPAAQLARRWSPATVLRGGLVVFALASAGCAVAPSFGALLGFRAAQAAGGAAAVVTALEVLRVVTGSERRAVTVWVAAGAAGAALGPALGGVLTETIAWQAVFAVQIPLALAPLAFLHDVPRPREPATGHLQPRFAPNTALALLSAGLTGALFLVVLLLIEGWRLSPIAAAAVMTALPLAAIATAPLARLAPGARGRAAIGAILVAGGLAALAVPPRPGWAWTLPPQILIGAGLALSLAALTATALDGAEPLGFHGGATIAARHAGVVAGLLLMTPVLVSDLDREQAAAERAGVSLLLASPVSTETKLELARELRERIDANPGRIPDLAPAFRSVDAQPDERPALARLEREIDHLIDESVTSAFSRSVLVAAALAFAALPLIALSRRVRS
jgi:MFS family permease